MKNCPASPGVERDFIKKSLIWNFESGFRVWSPDRVSELGSVFDVATLKSLHFPQASRRSTCTGASKEADENGNYENFSERTGMMIDDHLRPFLVRKKRKLFMINKLKLILYCFH